MKVLLEIKYFIMKIHINNLLNVKMGNTKQINIKIELITFLMTGLI